MRKIFIETLKLILCVSATFIISGLASIIEFGTGLIETLICIVLCIFSFQMLKKMGEFEIYE